MSLKQAYMPVIIGSRNRGLGPRDTEDAAKAALEGALKNELGAVGEIRPVWVIDRPAKGMPAGEAKP